MNPIGSIEAALAAEPFDAARDAVTAWRGRCLDLFARSEAAVTETLLVLAASDREGASIKLPHLIGQRYDALATVVDAGGAFASEGQAVAEALPKFRQHDRLRTGIVHGVFTVTLDLRGRWHLLIKVLALRSGREARDVLVFEQSEAADILATVEKDGSRLRSALGQLRRRIGTA